MPNWDIINNARLRTGMFGSTDDYGFTGAFMFSVPNEPKPVFCIASDQEGWQHVSVSFGKDDHKTPKWEVMCYIKDLFWEPEDCVVQFHPPHSEYVNVHGGCLHLWRCIDGREQPMPPSIMVGPKT